MDTELPRRIQATYCGNTAAPVDTIKILHERLSRSEEFQKVDYANKRSALARKIQVLKAQAQRRGMEQGKRASRAEALRQFTAHEHGYRAALQASRHDCLAIALSVAEEVIAKELKTQPTSLLRRISRALDQLCATRGIKVITHPDDSLPLRKAIQEEGSSSLFTVTEDSNVCAGNAILVGSSGEIELNWKNHLDAIKTNLRKMLCELGS